MKLHRYILPHALEVNRGSVRVMNKMGFAITGRLKIKQLGDRKLSQLAYGRGAIVRNEEGEITTVFMYELDSDTETPAYLFRLKILGNLNINQL